MFIPKVDETEFIPRVEDFGAVSQGTTPAAGGPVYPDRDPDDYQPRHGSIADLGGAAASAGGPGPIGGPGPVGAPGPVGGVGPVNSIGARLGAGPPGGYQAGDDRTEYFGSGFDSASFDRPEFDSTGFTSPGFDSPGFDSTRFEPLDSGTRPPIPAPRSGRTALHTIGEVLITCGMVVLLFVVYELYITDIFSAQKQASATTSLDKEWDTVTGPVRTNHYDLTDGHGIAKLYIPAFGQDYVFTVIEGTTQNDLAIGPGHYPGSALPGQPGDMAVAGHRVGEGAPFDDLGLVQSCDAILVETQTDWYVYRTLPMANEVAGWTTDKGRTTQCAGANGEAKVQPLGGLYSQTVGREIVLPTEGDVVAPIPHHPGAKVSAGQEASLLTLTTCNPKFSAAQRMILHAVLVKDWKKDAKDPNKMPPEMKETS